MRFFGRPQSWACQLVNHDRLKSPASFVNSLAFDKSDSSISRKHVLLGLAVVALFFGSLLAWAAFVPISSAAIAAGVVGKVGYRKTIQHLEGGIIHDIHIKDGDSVTSGQPLIELENIQSRSDFELLEKQKILATVKEASLIAEQLGHNTVKLPKWLNVELTDLPVREAIKGQIEASLIATRLHKEQLEIIAQRITRAEQKIGALIRQRTILEKTGEVVREELDKYLSYEKRGLVTRQMGFELKRQLMDNQADYSSNQVAIASTKQEITKLDMGKATLTASHTTKIVKELDIVRDQLVKLDEELSKTKDTLTRTVIRAPIDGEVVNLKVYTIGGVITPGQPLMDIVPSSGNLMIEARVNPMDRDTVRAGQDAEVRFSAFNQRVTEPVRGRVALISADRLIDPVTQEPYFKAIIELLEKPEDVLNGAPVHPGMHADVLIIIGVRTALRYLLDPIMMSFNHAFRED